MTPVLPCSVSNILLFPGTALAVGKANSSKRCYLLRKSSKHTLSFDRFVLPPPASVSLLSKYRRRSALRHKSHILSATESDVAVDESVSPVEDEDSSDASEIPSDDEASEESSFKSAASSSPAPARKSEMPPVKNEDLIPGATFTGKVRSIQPFGAFVDIGAFTEGLVHISRMSDDFVKDVNSIVSIGQEVTVRVVEVNFETKRIGFSMREGDDDSKSKQQRDSSGRPGDSRPPRKGRPKFSQRETTSFIEGENLMGTVKNLIGSGAFISLPDGEEGFLPQPVDDISMESTSLEVGDEVEVQVLRINGGRITLKLKAEENKDFIPEIDDGDTIVRISPFGQAFRENPVLAKYLDEREKLVKAAKLKMETKISEEIEKVDQNVTGSDTTEVQDPTAITDVGSSSVPIAVDETAQGEEASSKEADVDSASNNVNFETKASTPSPIADVAVLTPEKEEKASSETLASEGSATTTDQITTEANAGSASPSLTDNVAELTIEKEEEVSSEILAPEGNISITDQIIEASSKDEVGSDKKSESSPATPAEVLSSGSPIAQVEGTQTDIAASKDEVQIQAPIAENEVPAVAPVQEELASTPDQNGHITYSEGQPDVLLPLESKASISPALVKQLREETGAGMMDCKNALLESEGDVAKAQEFLRKKGLASAEKKASRATAEGRIGSYIHDGRIGVLVEVNCETDFVSRGDIFKELVDDLAMQVAACPQVQYLDTEDIPEEIVNKEREIEMQKEDLLSKPEQMRSRIVDGRIRKRLEELALLEQPYIKSDKVVVKDWVKQTIATVGENMKVKRFVRFNLGEGLEKKSQDFAAEVAAQTAAKPVAAPEIEQPTPVEAEKPAEERPPAVAVSAALVKQLREETGAGMMDCKKALSETGGDLEKAQEFLRKKGLSTADKKSSRLAAEGRIGSYIHDSRIGVLIEVNCETDFVGRSEKFKELVDDLAMQVVASPQVQFVSVEDIPESTVQKEKELEMQREDLQLKPENIREKIVGGRVSKRLGELALLEQPFIKDDALLVKDLVKQTIAAIGENIKVRRFVRFTLGEAT